MVEPETAGHERLGRYELLMKMASGGMASLYLARLSGPEQFEKVLCIKRVHEHLSEERRFVQMFLDESRIAAMIQHPNVAAVFDMGQIGGHYFMALEYVHGHNLHDVLRAARRLPDPLDWAYAVRIVADAAAGLHAAHELRRPGGHSLGVVHRDVSHQNILLSYDGHVKVVDFGIAYARERISSTQATVLKGKAAYMSPEQTEQKPLDRRSDVFSLGIVLYEAMCLVRLFKTSTELETILRVRKAKVPRPISFRADLPVELEKIALKALKRNPEDRYQTAAALQEALEELLVKEGRVQGQHQLASLMDRLFHGQRVEKDRRIELALAGKPHPQLGEMVFGGPMDESLTRASASAAAKSALLPGWLWVVMGGALGAVVVTVIALLVLGRKPEPPPPKLELDARAIVPALPQRRDAGAPGDARPAAPPKPATVTFTIDVRPRRAQSKIVFRGKTHPGPTFQATVKRSEAAVEVRVEAKGYQTQSLSLVPLESRTVQVALEKEQRRPHRRRRRRRLQWKPLPR
ncbi:MAG: serine/threonine-protein kinase [bacterium]